MDKLAMTDDLLNYGRLIDEAMHVIVRKALEEVADEGLPGDHHFYITFHTNYDGVDIPDSLREQYPDEMTIVLQHQFWDMHVAEDYFSVKLSFNNVRRKLRIPFQAITSFADPSVKFGLQFRYNDKAGRSAAGALVSQDSEEKSPPEPVNNVVMLDAFRKD